MTGQPQPHVDPVEAIAATGLGCFEWDPATGRFTLDEGGLAVFDLRPEEYGGMVAYLSRRIPVDEVLRLAILVQDIRAGHTDSYSSYFRIRHRDGSVHWAHTQGRAIRDPGLRVVGVVRDATEELAHSALRLMAEDDRQRHEAALREVAQALGEAFSVADVVAVLTGDQSMRRLGARGSPSG